MGQFSSRLLTVFNFFNTENASSGQGIGDMLNNNEENVQKNVNVNFGSFGSHFLMGGEVFVSFCLFLLFFTF